jgi:hypothetical protein
MLSNQATKIHFFYQKTALCPFFFIAHVICINFVGDMRRVFFILWLMVSFSALVAGAQDLLVDTVAVPDTAVNVGRVQQLKERVKQRIEEKMNEPYDTVRDGGYWWRALKHGKVDMDGGTIDYPAFIDFCWKVYKWGDKAFNSYDTAYVVSTGKNWKLMYKSNVWSDNYTGKPMQNIHFDMRSKLAINMGLQLSFMAVSVGYTVGVTNLMNHEKVSNKVDFSFTCARFTADAYYMENRGTTTAWFTDRVTGDKWTIKEFGGLYRKSYGVSAYYFFNNRRYAQAAAYCFSKYQKRSAGSFIAGFCLQHRDLGFKVDELPSEAQAQIPEGDEMPHFLYNDYCLLAGYGHNWVIGPKWLINLTVAPYVGYRHLLETLHEDRASAWSINLRARMGVVYNHKKFYVGLQNFGDFYRFKSERHHFIGTLLDVSTLVGIRF